MAIPILSAVEPLMQLDRAAVSVSFIVLFTFSNIAVKFSFFALLRSQLSFLLGSLGNVTLFML